jgi:hypothetical protein
MILMHFADAKKSHRLRRTIKALGRSWRTTAQLQAETGSMAVHTDIAELRANGKDVLCRYDHTDKQTGSRIYRYRLI